MNRLASTLPLALALTLPLDLIAAPAQKTQKEPASPSAKAPAFPPAGPFFEPSFPFFQSQFDVQTDDTPDEPEKGKKSDAGKKSNEKDPDVSSDSEGKGAEEKNDKKPGSKKTTSDNFVVRGILIPVANGYCIGFDQELLRVAGIWKVPADKTLVTLKGMAQASYATLHKKAKGDHPGLPGPIALMAAMHPGAATAVDELFHDSRKPAGGADEMGRGPLPVSVGHFDAVELVGDVAALRYHVGTAPVREWFEARTTDPVSTIYRHIEVAPHDQPVIFSVGLPASGTWVLKNSQLATVENGSATLGVATDSDAFPLKMENGELIATVPPSKSLQRVGLAIGIKEASASSFAPRFEPGKFPPGTTPALSKQRRWSETITTDIKPESVHGNGLALDRIELPESNPWKRRVRPSDIAFLTPDRAAVVTYDGDVWIANGLSEHSSNRITWNRFASGLHEPLAIAAVKGTIQVATKNGLVRLRDRDGNGEADYYENFSDLSLQSQTTRSFPLDMDIATDGSTYLSQGGITTQSGMAVGGSGTEHAGSIVKISPDGKSLEMVAGRAREPYFTLHPKTGVLTATDQQGHFIPSSVCYYVRPGDSFGFCEEEPRKLTPPLVWIPHVEDNSSASQIWLYGNGWGSWNDHLMHLSYGTGHLFLISPDFDAPTPQGAVIPLGLDTNLPLLHARRHPSGDSVYMAGFQIYDSRTKTNWCLVRLHPAKEPITTPMEARSCSDGVILTFDTPLKASSVTADNVFAKLWNYKRSSKYGSGRYTLKGSEGSDDWPIGQTVLSNDRKSVFVHLPGLPPVMQLQLNHDFELENGARAKGVVYFTIHQPHSLDLTKAGFPSIDLNKSVAVIHTQKEEAASAENGKTISQTVGCIACHSADGTTEGKSGPTWKNLFGSLRTFSDGASQNADDAYLKESMLDPEKHVVKEYKPGMPSYRGVLTDRQIESLILYIRSLKE